MTKKFLFTLNIGLAGASQEDEVDVDIPDEASEEEADELIHEAWKDWAWNYIDGGTREIE